MVWTNVVGVAFTATLLSVGDEGATFEFTDTPVMDVSRGRSLSPEVSTNTIPLTKLSPSSAQRACDLFGYTLVPPAVAAMFAQARRDLTRIDALLADERIDALTAKRRRTAIHAAFQGVCHEKGISAIETDALLRQLSR